MLHLSNHVERTPLRNFGGGHGVEPDGHELEASLGSCVACDPWEFA